MKIGICDDNIDQLKLINSYINSWATNRNIDICINQFDSGEKFIFDFEDSKKYDILFLDIQMSGITGIELAKFIRKYDKNVEIIFVSGYIKYAVDGYDVNAFRYLMKPLDTYKLNKCLDIIYENLNKINNDELITLDINNKIIRLDSNNIIYCSIIYPNVYIYTKSENIECKVKFKDLEDKLEKFSFIKPHRSYIVNLNYISCIEKNQLILDNGENIPISRLRLEKITNQFIEYFTNFK